MIAFEQVGDTDHHIKGGVVVTALGQSAALQGIAQVEEIQFCEPIALLKGGKGMELLAGKQVSGGAGRLLLEQGANQGEGSVEDGEQGKRRMALKGSDLSGGAGRCDRWRTPLSLPRAMTDAICCNSWASHSLWL